MTLSESGDSTRTVSLSGLFRGEFAPSQVETSATKLVDLACRGGWPEAVDLSAEDAQLIAREYLRLLRRESIPKQGKSGDVAERLLFSLARNLGQSATYKTLIADMSDASGLEADAVVELSDGRWAAFEFKVSEARTEQGVASLRRLRERVCSNPSARIRPPEFMAVVTGVSHYARRVEEDIYVVPLAALTA